MSSIGLIFLALCWHTIYVANYENFTKNDIAYVLDRTAVIVFLVLVTIMQAGHYIWFHFASKKRLLLEQLDKTYASSSIKPRKTQQINLSSLTKQSDSKSSETRSTRVDKTNPAFTKDENERELVKKASNSRF